MDQATNPSTASNTDPSTDQNMGSSMRSDTLSHAAVESSANAAATPSATSAGSSSATDAGQPEQTLFECQAPEYLSYQRGVSWYLLSFIVVAVIAYIGFLLSAVGFSALLIFVTGLFFAHTLSQPKAVSVRISNKAFYINDQQIAKDKLESLWIEKAGANMGIIHLFKAHSTFALRSIPYINLDSEDLEAKLYKNFKQNKSDFSHVLIDLSHLLKI
jgi:hypothetical protein